MTGMLLAARTYAAHSYIAQSRWLHSLGVATVPAQACCGACWLSGRTVAAGCAHVAAWDALAVVCGRQMVARTRVLLVADASLAGLVADAVAGCVLTLVPGPTGADQWSLLTIEGGGA